MIAPVNIMNSKRNRNSPIGNCPNIVQNKCREDIKGVCLKDIKKVYVDSDCSQTDPVIIEEPLAISIATTNNLKEEIISITMRTPGHDRELALGLLFSEGIFYQPDNILSIKEGKTKDDFNTITITLDKEPILQSERKLMMSSSCGVCGKTNLKSLELQARFSIDEYEFSIAQNHLLALPEQLRKSQYMFNQTGGNHATALFSSSGKVLSIAEDVGRHNALDKLIGAQILPFIGAAKNSWPLPLGAYGLLVSGRVSFEIMQKALMSGISTVIAIGAPTSLAIDVAKRFNMTLIGFLKENSFNIYYGTHRVRKLQNSV